MSDFNNVTNITKQKVSAVRLRTWTLTLVILFAIVFYLVVNIMTSNSFNWVDFLFICTLQIVSYCLYFPEGENFGCKNQSFLDNKDAYNDKAEKVITHNKISQLRNYCEIEYIERKERYINNECGYLGITPKELELLKVKTKKEIYNLNKFEFKNGDDVKIVNFSRKKRKVLYKLIYQPIPVEKNNTETILSAIENDGTSAIHDGSLAFKKQSYIKKFLVVFLVGLVFGYIGFTVRDSFGIAEMVQIFMYLTTMFTTSVMAFSTGETSSKVYKSHFYIELSTFLDGFTEWEMNKKEEKEVVE